MAIHYGRSPEEAMRDPWAWVIAILLILAGHVVLFIFIAVDTHSELRNTEDTFIVSMSVDGTITVHEGMIEIFDGFSLSVWNFVYGFKKSIFVNPKGGAPFSRFVHSPIKKRVLGRRFAVPVRFDDIPHEIEVAVDAVITNPEKAVFSVMMDPDLCARMERTLSDVIRHKLTGFSPESSYDEFNGPIHTAYLDRGFAYSMYIVDVRKLDVEFEKITVEHSVARKQREAFARAAPINNWDTIQKLRKMDEEIECIAQKLQAVYRTDVHPVVFECQRSDRRFVF